MAHACRQRDAATKALINIKALIAYINSSLKRHVNIITYGACRQRDAAIKALIIIKAP